MCRKCDAPKPSRAHHCSICNRCIMKMDHHCPWVNTCVAEYNQKHFLLFLLYVFILCVISVVATLSKIISCHNDERTISYTVDMTAYQAGFIGPTAVGDSQTPTPVVLNAQPLRRIRLYCGLTQGYLIGGMFVFFIALLFGIFTIAIFGDQISSLMQNQTNIEQLQQAPAKPRSLKSALQDVCGGTYTWKWLLPFPIKKSMRTVTY